MTGERVFYHQIKLMFKGTAEGAFTPVNAQAKGLLLRLTLESDGCFVEVQYIHVYSNHPPKGSNLVLL